jgi:hypothetical protein
MADYLLSFIAAEQHIDALETIRRAFIFILHHNLR